MTTFAPQSTDPAAPAWARTGSHLAGAAETFLAAVNAHWPNRSKVSDGTIGDARHVAEGSGSDHCPWLNGTVRAVDITAAGIDAPWLAEHLRILGAAGDHRLTGGGYVIYNRQITAPDFAAWHPYTGADPHTSHVHLSLTRDLAGYEDRAAWPTLSSVQPSPPHPAPAPADDVHWTGHDATGAGDAFRAEIGDEGPAVAHLQHELNVEFPAYSHLAEDGAYGHGTAAVVEQFDHRAAAEHGEPAADVAPLRAADGLNVGPAGARALHRHGLV